MRTVWPAALLIGLFPMLVLAPQRAHAQCLLPSSEVQDFGTNMKGCAKTVTFAARACEPGWHVCSAAEWNSRFAGRTPKYNYWTNDALRFSSNLPVALIATPNACWVGLAAGNDCGATPMRVCAPPIGDREGVYATSSTYYLFQPVLADASFAVVTAIDRVTFAPHTYAGPTTPNSFNGTQLGSAGALTLTFQTGDTGTDGSASFTKLLEGTSNVDRFTQTTDPLGNTCSWHNCGFNTAEPNFFYGGCEGDTTAGVLCCL